LPSHSQNKSAITEQKVVGCSQAEAEAALNALRELSLDAELSAGDKGLATLFYRQLLASLGSSPAREEVMRRATALVARIA
jgi:uncharacterized protein YgbK (DUF1537 family)